MNKEKYDKFLKNIGIKNYTIIEEPVFLIDKRTGEKINLEESYDEKNIIAQTVKTYSIKNVNKFLDLIKDYDKLYIVYNDTMDNMKPSILKKYIRCYGWNRR